MNLSVRVQGGDQALRALRSLEPTVAKKVGQDISKVGAGLAAEISNRAPSEPPVSGWRATPSGWPAWGQVTASHRRRGTSVTVSTSSNPSAIAGMLEFIGNGTKIKSDRGRHLSEMFNRRLLTTVPVKNRKAKGRLGARVLNEKYPEVIAEITQACEFAVAEVNRRMP